MTHGTLHAYISGCRCDECKARKSEYARLWRDQEGLRARCFDFAPLERIILGRDLALNTVASGTSVKEWRLRGIPWDRADTLCCKLGMHPFDVYGEDWYDLMAMLDQDMEDDLADVAS